MENNNKISIRSYFNKGKFVIPEYQRGYKWSVKEDDKNSSLEFFVNSIKKAFNANPNEEYFIEAVTVVEKEKEIIIVDGQQRTTSLFLLFATLGDKEFVKNKLEYAVRVDSHNWLNNQVSEKQDAIEDEDTQDIYYFKEAIEQIKEIVKDVNKKDEFLNFIKDNVYLLFNVIPEDKAINTFIALNGLKAIMKDEELIKSDLLIKSSRIENTEDNNDKAIQFGIEWKINEDRGRLARNWDRWLYWWNRDDVKEYFGTGDRHPLYYLLVTYWKINSKSNNEFSFDNFKSEFITDHRKAKLNFEGLRKLQKTFEDLYNNFDSYNFLGIILKTSSSKEEALRYFLNSNIDEKLDLEEYAKWSLIGSTHLEIINNSTEKIKNDGSEEEKDIITKYRKAQENIDLVNEKYVYWNENNEEYNDERKEYAFKFLLLLNLLEDTKLERKFDFSIWNNRSLEHIFPKSKFSCLNFDQEDYNEGSVHSIGNLVLLYGRDNSSFGAKDFVEKKNTYFNTSEAFKSRHLLHTISVFANSEWKEKEIIENKKAVIKRLNDYYKLNKNYGK